jgi:hypothetical protein
MNARRVAKIIVSFLFFLSLAACNMPQPAQEATQAPTITATLLPPPATQAPATTATSPAPATAVPPTVAPTQAPPTATPEPTATSLPAVRGFALFDKTKGEVRGYDLTTRAQLFKYIIAGVDYMGFGQSQMVGETLYNFANSEQKVIAVNKGTAIKLNFIPKHPSLTFAVSLDGSKIAWAFDNFDQQNPGSELWVAGIDGSGAQKIASIDPASNSKWQVYRPYRWLADGRLLYTLNPTGIGGYILFNGFGGILIYDPANSAKPTQVLFDAGKPNAGNMCLKEISPDLNFVVTECNAPAQGQLSLQELSSGKLTPIAVVADQGTAGSALYSPSGAWLAYAVARSEPDNEAGQVVVVPAAGGEPKVIASFGKGYVHVVDWIDDDTLLLESYQSEVPILWTIKRDSSGLVKIGDGSYIGLIK